MANPIRSPRYSSVKWLVVRGRPNNPSIRPPPGRTWGSRPSGAGPGFGVDGAGADEVTPGCRRRRGAGVVAAVQDLVEAVAQVDVVQVRARLPAGPGHLRQHAEPQAVRVLQ
jgi:hypothetical protein